jgi:hypothetical protein
MPTSHSRTLEDPAASGLRATELAPLIPMPRYFGRCGERLVDVVPVSKLDPGARCKVSHVVSRRFVNVRER